MRRGSLRRLAGAGIAAGAIIATAVALVPASSRAGLPTHPNFLVILVDDQASNTFTRDFMPETYRRVVNPGTKFTSGLAAPPLCCPDRAGILTGQYPHNHGVFSNDPGYPSLTDKEDTLPVWLRNAGYRTGFIGKFLNDSISTLNHHKAPGFERWFATDDGSLYFNYSVADQQESRKYGTSPGAYSTNVFTRQASRFIDAQGSRPFFLWLAYNAPHDSHQGRGHCKRLDPLVARGSDYGQFAQRQLPRASSFNEADVSDKPARIRDLPELGPSAFDNMTRRYRCTAGAMREVDRGIARLMREMNRSGALRNTIVIYTSDNGYFFGEHRLNRGKALPYEPALRVPYAVRVPSSYRDAPQPSTLGKVVANIDIAPTLLDYAGGVSSCASDADCRVLDGRSLRPLLGGGGEWPADRGVLAEIDARAAQYSAIRTHQWMYTEYPDGERELYDLRHDRSELHNRAGEPSYASTELALATRLAALRNCSGTTGVGACE
jgi:arylsulfatase A-like enzyme